MEASRVSQAIADFHGRGSTQDTVLVLPSELNSYQRLRIHELVQSFEGLETQSFGEEAQRQLCIFWSTPVVATKKPAQAVYVPRARREPAGIQGIKLRFGTGVKLERVELSEQDKLELSNQNIVEIYDFGPELKTGDIIQELGDFKSKYDLKWVDDNHALAKFQSTEILNEALAAQFAKIKLRPLIQASEQSKDRVHHVYMFHDPNAVRPETSSKVANRLVLNALGLSTKSRRK